MPIKLRNDTVLIFIILYPYIRLKIPNVLYNNYLTNKENLNTASIIADIPRLYNISLKMAIKKYKHRAKREPNMFTFNE